MGLTRIKAEQISDIDYKQAVRAVSLSNITLSGGAPASVDGVSLLVNDRILVNGQNTGSQNGIYQVETVGIGSNGTWIRSTDTNTTGELEAGTIVMVTEGAVYKDTQWKLVTNNPIVIGTTALVFEQNSAYAFGNVYANGTAVVASSVGDTLTLTPGTNISITGNATAKSVTIGVTGLSLNSIANGTSNVNVVSSGGNVTVGVAGVSNVAVFSSTGVAIAGNITSGNASITSTTSSTSKTTGALTVAGGIGVAGDLYAGNSVTVDGGAYGNVVATQFASLFASGSGPNPRSIMQVRGADGIAGIGIQGVSGGNGQIYANTGIIFTTGATLRDKDFPTGGTTRAIIDSNGLSVTGLVSATGNITGSYILGNGSQLTGIDATSIQNGTSNVKVVSSGGNVTTSVGGTSNVLIVTSTGANIAGTLNTGTGNANVGNLGATSVVATNLTGTLQTAAQTNVTSVGTLTSLAVSGAITVNSGAAATAIVNGATTGVGNIGSSTTTFNTVFAKATTAQYADLAENYVADKDYPVGTVLRFGGSHEVTQSDSYHDTRVAGTVSENPAYLMNSGLDSKHTVAVALLGRVPCRVVGTIAKGDRLVASNMPGVATALDLDSWQPGCIIGKALESFDSEHEGMIEIVVGRQ